MHDMIRENPTNLERTVFAEQVRYLYANAQRSVPFNVITPFILLLVFWPVARHTALLARFGALAAASIIRFLHVRRVLARADIIAAAEPFARHFIISSTATALLWSAGFIIVGAALPPPYRMLYLLTLGGIAAGALTSIGTHRTCYLLFLAGLFLPVLAALTVQGTQLSVTVAILVILLAGMLAATHKVTYEMLVTGFRDKIDNEVLAESLERTNNKLEAANKELGTRAETDGLTGIPNRRYFEQRFAVEWQRARRSGACSACLMLDIDHFKQFNDYYGHAAGDECLKRVAAALDRQIKRPSDILARYGGEEFVVLLPETELEGAKAVAEGLTQTVGELAIRHEASSVSRHVTVSVGVAAAVPERLSDRHEMVNAADEALYAAKRQGRNRAVVFDSSARNDEPLK
ncbi:MAG: Phytochrome-like protein cph2 [Gammaproteobacteria bacterium]|nr:Phytochrome-like protein cph2 [Gammaproteobacteria bacterium]